MFDTAGHEILEVVIDADTESEKESVKSQTVSESTDVDILTPESEYHFTDLYQDGLLEGDDFSAPKDEAVITGEKDGNDSKAITKKRKNFLVSTRTYYWFCSDERLKALRDIPKEQEIVTYFDVLKIVNERWKKISPERRSHYAEIARYELQQRGLIECDRTWMPESPAASPTPGSGSDSAEDFTS